MKISVISTSGKVTVCQYYYGLLPAFIIKGNVQFQLAVSENESVIISLTKAHKLLEILPTDATGTLDTATTKFTNL